MPLSIFLVQVEGRAGSVADEPQLVHDLLDVGLLLHLLGDEPLHEDLRRRVPLGDRGPVELVDGLGDVPLVLQAHMHGYERFEYNGITYVTTAGGGGNIVDVNQNVATVPAYAGANVRGIMPALLGPGEWSTSLPDWFPDPVRDARRAGT